MANPVDILNAGTEVPLGATLVPQNTIATVDLDDPDTLADVVRYVDQLLGVAGAGGVGDAVLAANQTFTGTNLFTQDVTARSAAATQVVIGSYGGLAAIVFGLAGDAQIYRVGAGQLRTNSEIQLDGTAPKIVKDTAGGTSTFLEVKAAADANAFFDVDSNGTVRWGAGGATPLDTTLARTGASLLTLSGNLAIADSIIINDGATGIQAVVSSAGQIIERSKVLGDSLQRYQRTVDGTTTWGDGTGTGDVTLARTGASLLQLNGTLRANLASNIPGFAVKRDTDGDNKFEIDRDGAIRWLDGTGTLKSVLGRSGDDISLGFTGAGKFTVGNDLEVGTDIFVQRNTRLGDSPADTVAFHGVAGVAQQATPVTLGDVITVLQNLGLVA